MNMTDNQLKIGVNQLFKKYDMDGDGYLDY